MMLRISISLLMLFYCQFLFSQSPVKHELGLGLISTEPNLGFENFAKNNTDYSLSFLNSYTYKLVLKDKIKLRARLDRIDYKFQFTESGLLVNTESTGFEFGLGAEVNFAISEKFKLYTGLEFVKRKTDQSDEFLAFSLPKSNSYTRESDGINILGGISYSISPKLSIGYELAFSKLKTNAEKTDGTNLKRVDRELMLVPVNMLAFQISL